jgi:Phage integrase family
LFASEAGSALDYSDLRRRVLLPAIEASGIDWPKGVAFHLFRRTAASLLHQHGKSVRQLADWLGHHDPSFTMRWYVGQMDEGLGDAGFLDELIPARRWQRVATGWQRNTRDQPQRQGCRGVRFVPERGGAATGRKPGRRLLISRSQVRSLYGPLTSSLTPIRREARSPRRRGRRRSAVKAALARAIPGIPAPR